MKYVWLNVNTKYWDFLIAFNLVDLQNGNTTQCLLIVPHLTLGRKNTIFVLSNVMVILHLFHLYLDL